MDRSKSSLAVLPLEHRGFLVILALKIAFIALWTTMVIVACIPLMVCDIRIGFHHFRLPQLIEQAR